MKFYEKPRRQPQIIIVSLIDIFVILLIFTVMTMKFKNAQPQVPIKLPDSKTSTAEDSSDSPVVVSVSENEEVFVGDQKVAVEDLAAALKEVLSRKPTPVLALNADRKVPFGTIVRVLDALKEAGVKGNLSFFTEPGK